MLVASGKVDVPKLLDSVILMAKDENSLHEQNEQDPGCWKHADGWGAAYRSKKGNFVITRSPKAIFDDPDLDKLRKIKTDLLIVHVRRKAGSEISLENTHPFKANHPQLGECIFCHNGFIQDEIIFDPKYKPKGQTDSERLFYSILSGVNDKQVEKAIRNNLRKYSQTKGSNVILATKEKTYVAMRKTELSKYYGMSIGKGNDFLVVSSEKLKTFPDISWRSIKPGSVITINNGSTGFAISSEKKNLISKIRALIKN